MGSEFRRGVIIYVWFPPALRIGESLLHKCGINLTPQMMQSWWNRFGPMIAVHIRKRRAASRNFTNWAWHFDEVSWR